MFVNILYYIFIVRPSCKQERERILSKVEQGGLLILGMLIPDCDQDGSYSAVQCHVPSKTCWCADKFGEEIDGTKVRFKKPDCRGKNQFQTTFTNLHKSSCVSEYRIR